MIGLFNKSKNLQHFYDQFIDLIQTSIKLFIPPYPKNNKRKKYPSNIKKLLKEKLILYKKSKKNKSFSKDYKIKSKEYELAVKKHNLEYEKYFCTNPNFKKFYSYVKSKIKLNTSLPPLFDHHKDKIVTSDFERATLFNKNFQSVFKQDQNHQSFKQPKKMQ